MAHISFSQGNKTIEVESVLYNLFLNLTIAIDLYIKYNTRTFKTIFLKNLTLTLLLLNLRHFLSAANPTIQVPRICSTLFFNLAIAIDFYIKYTTSTRVQTVYLKNLKLIFLVPNMRNIMYEGGSAIDIV